MKRSLVGFALLIFLTACAPATPISSASSNTLTPDTSTPDTSTPGTPILDTPTLAPPTPTSTSIPTNTATPLPIVESLKATVTAKLLSCRYGPGAHYLYLYALRQGANIELIGRTDANNWVMVEGKSKCWVNTDFLEIKGDPQSLKIMYPNVYKLPITPYYPPTDWVGATRDGNTVHVAWNEVPLRAGDEEDENMLHYIIEVWRCEDGQIIFDPLGTNDLSITFIDEAGCPVPSHGRVYVQEKHGFSGPVEIPWPE